MWQITWCTFTNHGDIIVQGEDELIVNIVLIQKAQCVSRLDELKWFTGKLLGASVRPVGGTPLQMARV